MPRSKTFNLDAFKGNQRGFSGLGLVGENLVPEESEETTKLRVNSGDYMKIIAVGAAGKAGGGSIPDLGAIDDDEDDCHKSLSLVSLDQESDKDVHKPPNGFSNAFKMEKPRNAFNFLPKDVSIRKQEDGNDYGEKKAASKEGGDTSTNAMHSRAV